MIQDEIEMTDKKISYDSKPCDADRFLYLEKELVGEETGMHGKLAKLMGLSEIGVKRCATSVRICSGLRTKQ